MIFLFLSFGQLYLLTIFRFLIGYDYVMYAKAFMDLQTQDFWNFTYYDWEYGFVFITKILGMILPSYTSYFAVIAIFTLIPVAIFIYRNTEKVWIGTFMYINFFLFLYADELHSSGFCSFYHTICMAIHKKKRNSSGSF